jgi:hypothetical protein
VIDSSTHARSRLDSSIHISSILPVMASKSAVPLPTVRRCNRSADEASQRSSASVGSTADVFKALAPEATKLPTIFSPPSPRPDNSKKSPALSPGGHLPITLRPSETIQGPQKGPKLMGRCIAN